MTSQEDKRQHIRLDFNQLVRVEPYEGDTLHLIGINYSINGIALNSPKPLPLGEFVDLKFRINNDTKQVHSMTAEVIQNQRHSNTYITGLKFVGELN